MITLTLHELLTLAVGTDESLYLSRQWITRNCFGPHNGLVIQPSLAAQILALDPEELATHIQVYTPPGIGPVNVLWTKADWTESNERRRLIVAASTIAHLNSPEYRRAEECEALITAIAHAATGAPLFYDAVFIADRIHRMVPDPTVPLILAYARKLEDYFTFDTKTAIKLIPNDYRTTEEN